MTCDNIAELMSPYLEGELPSGDRELFEAHLESCGECRQLLDLMRETRTAMANIPEIEPPAALMERLRAIPNRKSGLRAGLDWLMRPALQPALSAAAIFLTLFSFYIFNPDRGRIDKAVDLSFHRGVSRVERIWARAEDLTQTLAGYTDGVLVSLSNLVKGSEE